MKMIIIIIQWKMIVLGHRESWYIWSHVGVKYSFTIYACNHINVQLIN